MWKYTYTQQDFLSFTNELPIGNDNIILACVWVIFPQGRCGIFYGIGDDPDDMQHIFYDTEFQIKPPIIGTSMTTFYQDPERVFGFIKPYIDEAAGNLSAMITQLTTFSRQILSDKIKQ